MYFCIPLARTPCIRNLTFTWPALQSDQAREPGLSSQHSDRAAGWEIRKNHWVFAFPRNVQTPWDPPSLLFNGYRGSFPGWKRPGRDADHLSPSSAEVDKEWKCSSTLPYTGRFIMFSVITNVYNNKTKGPTLIELFTVTRKRKRGFFFLKQL